MKAIILRFIYHRYRAFFYSFFVEEMIADMPNTVSEPAMAFLGNGKEKMEKWILYWVHLIQRRIVTDKATIEEQTGMILMLKILRHLVMSQTPTRSETILTKEPKTKPNHASEVEKAIKDFKEERKNKTEAE